MKSRIIPVFVFVAVIISACQSNEVMESKNVAQSEIHQQYYITQDYSDETFVVNTEFRVAGPNGTTLVLSEPSDITCNGKELKLDTYLLGGAHYISNNISTSSKGTVDMDFVDYEKKHYKNSFTVNGIDFAVSKYVLKDSNNVVNIKTVPLEPNENMWLDIHGDSLSAQVKSQSGNISITANDLKDFGKNEKLTLQITREKMGNLKQASARGGSYVVTSRSRKATVIVN